MHRQLYIATVMDSIYGGTMVRDVTVDARWDREAGVWLATSHDVPGLVVEAPTWADMISEVGLVLPEFLSLSARSAEIALTFRAEEHMTLTAA